MYVLSPVVIIHDRFETQLIKRFLLVHFSRDSSFLTMGSRIYHQTGIFPAFSDALEDEEMSSDVA